MLGKIVSSMIGAKIDKKDGDSGAKGAAIGWFAPGIAKGVLKLGALAAVGAAVTALAKRGRSASD